MKLITVRKTLRYDPTCNGKFSRYEGYCRVTAGTEDPGISPGQKLINGAGFGKVVSSPALRARESVRGRFTIAHELAEIGFVLSDLTEETDYDKYGSEIVRKRFLERFISDKLGEKRRQIKFRMERLINTIKQSADNNCLLVSHSFCMKILETYIREKDLFEEPAKLSGYLNPKIRTYNFGEGFEFIL